MANQELTQGTNEGQGQENKNRVSSLETRSITGQELIESYTQQNEQFARVNEGRKRQAEYMASIPAVQEKPNRSQGGTVIITREQELHNIARREAINVLTKGEFKKKLALVKDLNRIKENGGLNAGQEEQRTKALERITMMNKFANHPKQEAEMKRLQVYCYDKNCTEKGISDTIAATEEKIKINNEMIDKIKGLENVSFTINIKHDKSLGALKLDENFSNQLEAAIAAKKTIKTPAKRKPKANDM